MPTLVMLRHRQSIWNLENRFTGWVDVDLSALGGADKLIQLGRKKRCETPLPCQAAIVASAHAAWACARRMRWPGREIRWDWVSKQL